MHDRFSEITLTCPECELPFKLSINLEKHLIDTHGYSGYRACKTLDDLHDDAEEK